MDFSAPKIMEHEILSRQSRHEVARALLPSCPIRSSVAPDRHKIDGTLYFYFEKVFRKKVGNDKTALALVVFFLRKNELCLFSFDQFLRSVVFVVVLGAVLLGVSDFPAGLVRTLYCLLKPLSSSSADFELGRLVVVVVINWWCGGSGQNGSVTPARETIISCACAWSWFLVENHRRLLPLSRHAWLVSLILNNFYCYF